MARTKDAVTGVDRPLLSNGFPSRLPAYPDVVETDLPFASRGDGRGLYRVRFAVGALFVPERVASAWRRYRRGETPEAAALRELAEEIGFSATALLPAGSACGIWDG